MAFTYSCSFATLRFCTLDNANRTFFHLSMNMSFSNPVFKAQSGPRIERLTSLPALADAVARVVATSVAHALQRHERASLVLSGGGTPEIYLPQVASLTLPWDHVTILLADERWVDEGSPHSNAAMLRRTFLNKPGPAQAQFIPLKNESPTAADGLTLLHASLPPLDQPYSLALLGMGNDGHFASLFPGTPRLAELLSANNTERVVAIPAPTTASPHVERVSLTLAEIKRSERIVLVLQGIAKLDLLQKAWEAADALTTPVIALGDVEVLWCP